MKKLLYLCIVAAVTLSAAPPYTTYVPDYWNYDDKQVTHVDPFKDNMELTTKRLRAYTLELVGLEYASPEYKAAVEDIRRRLMSDMTVESVDFFTDKNGLIIHYKAGYSAALYYAPQGSKGSAGLSQKQDTAVTNRFVKLKEAAKRIDNKKVLAIAAQYWDWGDDDDVPQLAQMLSANGFDVAYKHYDYRQVGSITDFTEWSDYGIILISTHGMARNIRLREDNAVNMGLDLNILFTKDNYLEYKDDIESKIFLPWTNCNANKECHDSLLATDLFFKKYLSKLSDSLLYISACHIGKNDAMAEITFNKGAETMIGYSDLVQVSFAEKQGLNIFTRLIGDESISDIFQLPQGNDLSTGFHTGIKESDNTPAEIVVFKKSLIAEEESDSTTKKIDFETLLTKKVFNIAGSFATYDFEDVDEAFDWIFVTTDKHVFQFQGKESTDKDLFGWQEVYDIDNRYPSWYMFPLGEDVDGDGSQRFDWIFLGVDSKAIYKLDGITENGTFKYSDKIEMDYVITDNKVTFFKKGK
jgi:hypothetical protein